MQAEPKPIPFRGGGFTLAPRRYAAVIFFALLIAAWEFVCWRGWVSPIFLPPPHQIANALIELAQSGLLLTHVSVSLSRIISGWIAGTLAGLIAGFAMGIWSLSRGVGLPIVSALFPIPKIALLPLFILWLGTGERSKIFTIALGLFFPTVIAVYSGIDSVPRNLIRMAQSFNLPWLDVLRKIVLPGALPSILSGFRISASIALLLVVAAEMIGAEYGIGAFIILAGNLSRSEQLLAGVVILSVLGLILGTALSRLERFLLRWR